MKAVVVRRWTKAGIAALAVILGLTVADHFVIDVNPVAYNYGLYGGGQTLAIETGAGPGGGPHVKVVNPSNFASIGTANGFYALPDTFRGGIYVARGDLNGDGTTGEIVAGGNGLVGLKKADGTSAGNNFAPYGNGYGGEVRVAAADLDGDGDAEIITAAGPGGGPHVRAFNANGTPFAAFGNGNGIYAYNANYMGGVYVAAADLNGDGNAEIITGTGQGGGPHVRAFSANGAPFALTGQGDTNGSGFFAYNANFTGGVRVAAGYFDNSGRALIVVGAGPGGGPHVKIFKPTSLATLPAGVAGTDGFYAYPAGFTGGVFPAVGDVDADEDAEIITGAGAGGASHVRGFDETGAAMPGTIGTGFYAYPQGCPGTNTQGTCFTGGVTVAAGKV